MAFVLIRWSKWPGATSPTSSVSPASSRQTRARTSVASLTSAAPWRSTTVFAPTSRWSLRVVRGRMTPSCRGEGTGHRETTRTPITKQRAGSWGGDQPAAPLTVMTAVCFREGGRSVGLHVHDFSLKRDSHQHTSPHSWGVRHNWTLCLTVCLSIFTTVTVWMPVNGMILLTVRAIVFLLLCYLSLCFFSIALSLC